VEVNFLVDDSIVYSLAKVIAATAWADGQVTLDEINCMKDLLFRLPNLTEMDWERLEMYLDSPVEEPELERLVEELRSLIKTDDDKRLVQDTMAALVQADGELDPNERVVFDEVVQAINSTETGVSGKMSQLFRPSLNRRSKQINSAPNREEFFDDFINNRIYYKLRQDASLGGENLTIDETGLRKMSLAGGIMARVAYVDREVTDDEIEQISHAISDGWKISPAEARVVAEVAASEMSKDLDYLRLCWNFFNMTDQAERLRFLDGLFAVAASDGFVSDEEMEEIRSISTSLKMTHKEFIEAKLRVPKDIRET
jgi:uncharacterized tellurite resistance protein B-like protein